jgi:hypothetical protein
MPTSDILKLADDLATALTNSLGSGETNVDIARAYRIEFDLSSIIKRYVRIFPVGYAGLEPVTRREDYYDVILRLTIVERYTGKGDPSNDWLDERVDWVETNIFNPFADSRAPFRLGEYWSQFASVESVYDYDLLNEDQVFASDVLLTFRRTK